MTAHERSILETTKNKPNAQVIIEAYAAQVKPESTLSVTSLPLSLNSEILVVTISLNL